MNRVCGITLLAFTRSVTCLSLARGPASRARTRALSAFAGGEGEKLEAKSGDGLGGDGIVLAPASGAYSSVVVWLHGLGDSAMGWYQAMPALGLEGTKFILPTAPQQPITVNGGMPMPGWTDIYGLEAGQFARRGTRAHTCTLHEGTLHQGTHARTRTHAHALTHTLTNARMWICLQNRLRMDQGSSPPLGASTRYCKPRWTTESIRLAWRSVAFRRAARLPCTRRFGRSASWAHVWRARAGSHSQPNIPRRWRSLGFAEIFRFSSVTGTKTWLSG